MFTKSPSEFPDDVEPLKDNQSDLHHVVWGGAVLLAASIFGNGVSYLFGIFLARMMGVEQFGTYAIGLTIFNSIVTISLIGLQTGSVKFVSQYLALKDGHKLNSTIVLVILLTMVTAVAASIGLVALGPWLSHSVYRNVLLNDVLWWFAMGIPFAAVSTVMLSILQAYHVVRYTIFIKYGWEPIGKFGLVALLLWLGFGLTGVISGLVLVLAVSLVVALTGITRIAGITPLGVLSWRPCSDSTRALLSFCLPLTLANFFGVVAPKFDILFLGYWGNVQDVAVYVAAFQSAATLALILGAFDRTFAPAIGRGFATGDRQFLKEQFRLYTRLSFSLSIPLFVLLTIFSTEILSLFGPAYLAGSTCLILLASAQLFGSVIGTSSTLLLMGGHSRLVLLNTLSNGGLMIVLTIALIPIWGIIGAAIAGMVSHMSINVARMGQVWYLHRIHPLAWNLLKPTGAGVLTGIILLSAKGLFSLPFYPILMLIGVMLYIGLVFCFRLESTDYTLLKTALDKVKRSIKARSTNAIEPVS